MASFDGKRSRARRARQMVGLPDPSANNPTESDPYKSKLVDASPAAVSSELDVFLVPFTNLSIERQFDETYQPVSSLVGSRTYEFMVLGSDHFIDLSNTIVYMEIEVKNNSGEDFNKTSPPGTQPSDNVVWTAVPMHSLFSQVDLYMNNKTRITDQNNTYPYKAYFNTLFYTRDKPRATFLNMEGVSKTATKVDSMKQTIYTGRIQLDMSECDKVLLSHCDLMFRFHRTRDNFPLTNNVVTGTKDFRITFKKLLLIVRKFQVNPSVATSIEKTLLSYSAKYSFVRKVVMSYNIAANQTNVTIDNILIGVVPKRVVCGLVDNDAYVGNGLLDAYEFKHFKVTNLSLFANGNRYPSGRGYDNSLPESSHIKPYAFSYLTFFRELAQDSNETTLDITYDQYVKHNFLYAFNLAPLYGATIASGSTTLNQVGSMRIEITFSEAPTKSLALIIYAEYDSMVQIDHKRQVTTSW